MSESEQNVQTEQVSAPPTNPAGQQPAPDESAVNLEALQGQDRENAERWQAKLTKRSQELAAKQRELDALQERLAGVNPQEAEQLRQELEEIRYHARRAILDDDYRDYLKQQVQAAGPYGAAPGGAPSRSEAELRKELAELRKQNEAVMAHLYQMGANSEKQTLRTRYPGLPEFVYDDAMQAVLARQAPDAETALVARVEQLRAYRAAQAAAQGQAAANGQTVPPSPRQTAAAVQNAPGQTVIPKTVEERRALFVQAAREAQAELG